MTEISRMAVTGDSGFMERYRLFCDVLAERCQHLERVASGDVYSTPFPGKLLKLLFLAATLRPGKHSESRQSWQAKLHKRKAAFVRKSRQTERKLQRLSPRPDLVLHLFGMYAPFLHESAVPFAMTLDYTMALAIGEWPEWAPFDGDKDRRAWLEAEKDAYARAAHLFPWSNRTRQSLINDYGVPEEKITVIGSAGQFRRPYEGAKSFGSGQLIFNGSEWERKGGDIVLAAFRQVRQAVPTATLVVVGSREQIHEPGVLCAGHVGSPAAMQALLLGSDLLLAPARCEPYGNFLVEGMNCGVPCIASSRGGMPEIVDHGVNGLVLPELSPECLAESIVALLEDIPKLERFSGSARAKVRAALNWDSIADKIFEALQTRSLLS